MVEPCGATLKSPHAHYDIHALLEVWMELVEITIDLVHSNNILSLGQGQDISTKDAISVKNKVLSHIDGIVGVDVVLVSWAKV
jgi:hypothetical protein